MGGGGTFSILRVKAGESKLECPPEEGSRRSHVLGFGSNRTSSRADFEKKNESTHGRRGMQAGQSFQAVVSLKKKEAKFY